MSQNLPPAIHDPYLVNRQQDDEPFKMLVTAEYQKPYVQAARNQPWEYMSPFAEARRLARLITSRVGYDVLKETAAKNRERDLARRFSWWMRGVRGGAAEREEEENYFLHLTLHAIEPYEEASYQTVFPYRMDFLSDPSGVEPTPCQEEELPFPQPIDIYLAASPTRSEIFADLPQEQQAPTPPDSPRSSPRLPPYLVKEWRLRRRVETCSLVDYPGALAATGCGTKVSENHAAERVAPLTAPLQPMTPTHVRRRKGKSLLASSARITRSQSTETGVFYELRQSGRAFGAEPVVSPRLSKKGAEASKGTPIQSEEKARRVRGARVSKVRKTNA